ncbi:MBOAT family O-acyltransferase [Ekhidna sp. To15]|uniref:MBOAT family O-acyltransferase n=1 Tax=Ekhidna sp. To15 TaxID=3395267 RepID=UPI003F528683
MMQDLFSFIGFSFFVVILIWVSREKYQLSIIGFSCLLFIGYFDFLSCAILIISSTMTWFLSRKAYRYHYLIIVLIACLTIVFTAFKLRATLEQGMFSAALPLGMSFYIFRLLHYVIEVYKGNLKNLTYSLFLSYMFYLPVIIVGPIIRVEDWVKEIKRRRWDSQLFSAGLERILYGLVKIIVLGNYLFSAKLANYISNISDDHEWLANYLDCLRYSGNSYMQFAGYSDIAIGFSMLLGIRLMENFNYPFLAANINDFWKRWHISLSQWCRDYIFTPIASSTRLPTIAILISMLVLGLWHEISPRYILWASFHGLGIVIWNLYNRYVKIAFQGVALKLYDGIAMFVTFNFVIISFIWVKETSIEASLNAFRILLGF